MNTERKDTSRGQLELKLGGQISALISASHALNVRTAAAFDSSVQPAAFHIVRWLYSYGPTSASVLAESTAMDRSSVSRLIKQLENLGYIKRKTPLTIVELYFLLSLILDGKKPLTRYRIRSSYFMSA